MTSEERKLALYCLKASSDYHSEVCEECINYPNCDHTIQDDVTETIIKALEQEPKRGHWISHREHCEMNNLRPSGLGSYFWCSECDCGIDSKNFSRVNYNYCPNCGAKMVESEEE